MIGILGMRRMLVASVVVVGSLLAGGCSHHVRGSSADFAVPGCERAWTIIDVNKGLPALRTLISNDCAQLYQSGWRLPINANKGGVDNPELCGPAWAELEKAELLEQVEFTVTHNCPVFYRHGWIVPPR